MNLNELNTTAYISFAIFKALLLTYSIIKVLNLRHNPIHYIVSTIIYFSVLYFITPISSTTIRTLIFIVLLSLQYAVICKLQLSTSLITCIICIGISNIFNILAVAISYFPNKFFYSFSDIFNILFISIIHFIMLYYLLHNKRLRNMFNIILKHTENEYFNILSLNISVGIIFSFILFMNLNTSFYKEFFPPLVIFAILMVVTIYYSVKQYYKQKLFNTELVESKQTIETMKNEITRLETENLAYSKINHTLKHKQRTLEYKAATLAFNSEIANELTPVIVPALFKSTEIKELDDLFSYMQAECNKHEIDLELQIRCDLYELINNFISLEDLETLLSDHIRNSIIALNNSKNVNKSLLVKIGQYNSCYVISIYDSGIEFEQSTLEKLGNVPITTHSNTGGSGLGFMNTFDTLRKYEITMEINEIGAESVDNYTKSITFIFNKTFDFNINSYRKNS